MPAGSPKAFHVLRHVFPLLPGKPARGRPNTYHLHTTGLSQGPLPTRFAGAPGSARLVVWTGLMSMSLALLSSPGVAAEPAGKSTVDFNRDIKPILSNICFKCHGPDPAVRKGGTDGLRLDTADRATAEPGGHAPGVARPPGMS